MTNKHLKILSFLALGLIVTTLAWADGVGAMRREAAKASGGGGVTDHGELDGLGDDDHTIYFLADGTRALTGAMTINEVTEPSAPANTAAKIWAADDNGFTSVRFKGSEGQVQDLARDSFIVVRNTSGAQIDKGKAVYVTGATGNVNNVALARANSASTMPAIGVMAENTANNGFGRVIGLGDLANLSILDTATFSEGEALWVSADAAGALVNSQPVHPNINQIVGYVLTASDGGAGRMFVRVLDPDGNSSGTRQNTFKVGDGTSTLTLTADANGATVSATGGSDSRVAFARADSGTNTSAEVQAIQHTTDGTAASGFGAHTAYDLENASGSTVEAATYGVYLEDAVAGQEVGAFEWKGLNGAGSLNALMYLLTDSNGKTHLQLGGQGADALNFKNNAGVLELDQGGGDVLSLEADDNGATLSAVGDSDSRIAILRADSGTTTVAETLALEHTTDGTAGTGFGLSLTASLENASGNLFEGGRLIWVYTDATDASEDTEAEIWVANGGTTTKRLTVGAGKLEMVQETTLSTTTGAMILNPGTTGYATSGGVKLGGDLVGQGNKNVGFSRVVESKTNGSGSPYNISATTDLGKTFNNSGATAEVYLNLPALSAASDAGQRYRLIIVDSDGARFVAAAGDVIAASEVVGSGGGHASSTTTYSVITLESSNDSTTWIATEFTGTWSVQ